MDGVDHIEREQEPSRSLLLDLPDPDQIPDGVYVILGTQTDAPLRARIQATVRHPRRRIEMQPLERRQMYEMINAANLQDEITSDQQDTVYDLSGGHPLALTYLLGQIDLGDDKQSAIKDLQEDHTYGGDIEATYRAIGLSSAVTPIYAISSAAWPEYDEPLTYRGSGPGQMTR